MRLILGSASPRRRELLAQIGVSPAEIRAADINEDPIPGELPRPYCQRMAREKAEALEPGPGEAILCADTTVAVGRRILGKPEDRQEAEVFLRLMSGRRHRVVTAIALRTQDKIWQKDVETALKMKCLSETELNGYLDTQDWQGKAGGYGIQGSAAVFIPWLQGSYSAVVGLPLAETANLLRAAGVLK